mmetsp:Transcript_21354/g.61784  ORF Transcript_21354/g.61784 Transcript_21354/m.61784 type:complete len:225 (-) Transcript_21354:843-1517(-)
MPELLVDAVRVPAVDLDESPEGRRFPVSGLRPEFHHEQWSLRLGQVLALCELHLLLADDVVWVVARLRRDAAPVAEQEGPAVLAGKIRELERALAEVVGQVLAVVKARRRGVLLVAKGLGPLPELALVVGATPPLLRKVIEPRAEVLRVRHSVDLDVAAGPQFHHGVVEPVLHVLVIAEHELLLALVALAAEVARVAGDHGPAASLDHEVHHLHGAEAHVVLTL